MEHCVFLCNTRLCLGIKVTVFINVTFVWLECKSVDKHHERKKVNDAHHEKLALANLVSFHLISIYYMKVLINSI